MEFFLIGLGVLFLLLVARELASMRKARSLGEENRKLKHQLGALQAEEKKFRENEFKRVLGERDELKAKLNSIQTRLK